MLLWACLIGGIVLIVVGMLLIDGCPLFDICEWIGAFLVSGGVIALIASVVMGCNVISMHVRADGYVAANKARYESLTYQLENDIYDNDNDLGKSELYRAVTNWNEDLARNKALQNDFWVGIFYPDVYDQFEFIEFPEG